MGSVSGAQRTAVRKGQPAGALDLQEEDVRRMRVGDGRAAAGGDVGAGRIGPGRTIRQFLQRAVAIGNEIGRDGENRFGEYALRRPSGFIMRLKIACELVLAFAVDDLERDELRFKNLAGGGLALSGFKRGAARLPVTGRPGPGRVARQGRVKGAAAEAVARAPEGLDGRGERGRAPARQLEVGCGVCRGRRTGGSGAAGHWAMFDRRRRGLAGRQDQGERKKESEMSHACGYAAKRSGLSPGDSPFRRVRRRRPRHPAASSDPARQPRA